MVTTIKKYTLRQWINKFGSAVIGMREECFSGQVLYGVYDGPSNDRIEHPLVVVRKAAKEEYKSQMNAAGHNPSDIYKYFYEVTTD